MNFLYYLIKYISMSATKGIFHDFCFRPDPLGVLAGIDEKSASARMNQYERGKHVLDISILERIGEVLCLPAAYFYATDDDLAHLVLRFYRFDAADKSFGSSQVALCVT